MKQKYIWIIILLCLCSIVVFLTIKIRDEKTTVINEEPVQNAQSDSIANFFTIPQRSKTAQHLEQLHLVNIKDIDPTIEVELKYATTDNFTGKILYEELDAAYLQPDVAQMLVHAHQYLRTIYPEFRLLVYDAVRPLSIQQIMWESIKESPYRHYVANPEKTGLHNYGAAVDLTIADSTLTPLDMGTPFDYFGKAAGTDNEEELLTQGLLTKQQVENRKLLRQVMRQAGFRSISGEWWHFNACSLGEAKQRYTLIEGFE